MIGYKNHNIKSRISVLIYFSIILIVILIGRLFHLQVIKHGYYAAISTSQYTKKYTLPAKRGKIYLRDKYESSGRTVIAMNNTLNMVYAVPKELEKKNKLEEAATKIAPIIGKKKEDILKQFSTSKEYVPLKHKLTDDESEAIKKLDIHGLVLVPESWRFWPEKSLLFQVLGFVNMESKGQYGIEQEFNEELSGTDGKLKAETDATGVIIISGKNVLTEPKDGDDIVLTIDKNIQANVEENLKKAIEKHKADGGSVLVMDPLNGDILAMASYYGGQPEMDLNNYNKIVDYSYFDNNILRQYEPGSIFKVITMAAGLDSGKIKPEDTYYEGKNSVVIDGHTIMNSDKKAHGEVSMSYILEQSLNLGTNWIMQKMGKDKFYEYITENFGFGSKTGMELSLEDTGSVSKPSQVGNHAYASISFGQAILATPLQITFAVCSVANGGQLVRPRLIESFIRDGKKEEKKPKQVIKRAISKETSVSLTQMMVDTIEKGHGKQAKVEGYKIAGKTGTAQVPDFKKGGYDPNKTIGSFVGFAPASRPRFVIFTKIENPKGVIWAEETAAPVFQAVAGNLLNYYQIPPDEY